MSTFSMEQINLRGTIINRIIIDFSYYDTYPFESLNSSALGIDIVNKCGNVSFIRNVVTDLF
jgi:hypothetical protein